MTSNTETKVLEIELGRVKGLINKTDDITTYIFKGIPYAHPPTGLLRFLAPTRPRPWHDTLDCTKDPPSPYTLDEDMNIIGSEDCLYIDVISPSLNNTTPLPVMFWIGSCVYTFTHDQILNPELLLKENVVFVRCNFRLGPFGFLSINDLCAPGNCGLKDVVMALQWVNKNIHSFGGDPNNVTIFGSGTGGAIVHLLMLSPMARGLFHKAIIQSASALNNWSLAKNPSLPALDLAKELGITTSDKIEAIEKMRITPAEKIMVAFRKVFNDMWNNGESDVFDALFKPSIEEQFEGQPAFLTKSPSILIKSGNYNKVPLIIGSNNIEAYTLSFVKEGLYDFEKYNNDLRLLVPRALAGEANKSKNIALQLLKFYTGEETLSEETTNQYLQLLSDYYFLYYVNKTVRLHSQYAPDCPVYYYIVNFAGEWSLPPNYQLFNSLGHSAEIPYIFPLNLPGFKGTKDSIRTRSKMVKLWTNFSKYGNPTPTDDDNLLQITWDPVQNKDRLNYLSIGPELTKGRNPFYERMLFWDNIHNEHSFLIALVHFNALGVVC